MIMNKKHLAITFNPIGTIHSPFREMSGMPIQPTSNISAPGTVEILLELSPGLVDLEGFSHIILIYHLHLSHSYHPLSHSLPGFKTTWHLRHTSTKPPKSDRPLCGEVGYGGEEHSPCGKPRHLGWNPLARYQALCA